MRGSLRDDDAFDRGTAPGAGGSRFLEYAQVLLVVGLHFLPGKHEVRHACTKTGAQIADASIQYFRYRLSQRSHFTLIERVSRAQRMNSRFPERLVGVDVSQPSDYRLVQQEWFDPAGASGEDLREHPVIKFRRQGLDSQVGHRLVHVGGKGHAAKLARNVKAQFSSTPIGAHDTQPDTFVPGGRSITFAYVQSATHSQVDQNSRSRIEIHNDVFASAPELGYLSIENRLSESGFVSPYGTGPLDFHGGYPGPRQAALEKVFNGSVNFRKLRHYAALARLAEDAFKPEIPDI